MYDLCSKKAEIALRPNQQKKFSWDGSVALVAQHLSMMDRFIAEGDHMAAKPLRDQQGELLHLLDSSLLKRGSIYAYTLLQKSINNRNDFCGTDAADIAYGAAQKIVEGKRRRRENYNFQSFFFGVIKSEVSNFLNSAYIRNNISNEDIDDNNFTKSPKEIDYLDNPEKLLADHQITICLKKRIISLLIDDEHAKKIALALLDGVDRNRLSAELLMSKKEIKNGIKRLRRKLPIIRDDLKKYRSIESA